MGKVVSSRRALSILFEHAQTARDHFVYASRSKERLTEVLEIIQDVMQIEELHKHEFHSPRDKDQKGDWRTD
ncbi:hypothetical protein LCGC14_2163710 [marine sediment metagenome]|uniref:Uncharacterized protein n=1 Tax=marine sediment metagenome TaxID=412755 RepID=A0A0F9EE81_9ZZZZ